MTHQTTITDQQLDEYEALARNATLLGAEIASPNVLGVLVAEVRRLRAAVSAAVAPPTDQATHRDRRERYAIAIHDAMETDLSLVDQEPAYQALIARAAEAAEALADAELATDQAAVLREAADAIDATFTGCGLDRYTRYGADLLRRLADQAQPEPGVRHVHITIHHPDPTTAHTAALCIADLIRGEYGDSLNLAITTDAGDTGTDGATS